MAELEKKKADLLKQQAEQEDIVSKAK